jgi:hypothetical protein
LGACELAFPDSQYAPPLTHKIFSVVLVTALVALKLWKPKIKSGLWESGKGAWGVSVPKASMDKYGFPFSPKDNIRSAGKFLGMQSIPIAHREDEFAHDKLWARVLRSDASHDLGPFFGRNIVHTSLRSQILQNALHP